MGSCANVEGMALGRSTITLFTVTGRKPRYLCTDFSRNLVFSLALCKCNNAFVWLFSFFVVSSQKLFKDRH